MSSGFHLNFIYATSTFNEKHLLFPFPGCWILTIISNFESLGQPVRNRKAPLTVSRLQFEYRIESQFERCLVPNSKANDSVVGSYSAFLNPCNQGVQISFIFIFIYCVLKVPNCCSWLPLRKTNFSVIKASLYSTWSISSGLNIILETKSWLKT